MGIEHRNRIEETLRQRLRGDRSLADQLAGFFDETREERFFVKNLERVQGVESGGTNLGDQVPDKPALNPFEADVRDTLTRSGLSLTPQYGASGCWIDFAVRHPLQPGRYVLALECDGATYHSSESARGRSPPQRRDRAYEAISIAQA